MPEREWDAYLKSHPDPAFAGFLRRGIRYGFRIGYNPYHPLRTTTRNHQSITANSEAVERYINSEIATGRLVPAAGPVHCSPIGLIPKPAQPGKFRLIVDLSAPADHSVNDGIPPELCSLAYASVEDAACLLRHYGKGALMAKLDLRSAYRMVPVHPVDQSVLGLRWGGATVVDRALPFGLRSAPKIFNAVADGLSWALIQEGVTHPIHYLDDFLFCGPPNSRICQDALSRALPISHRLGLPVAAEKVEGPATVITFLGIEVDSVAQELRLPQVKLVRLKAILAEWEKRRSATKHQLQCLIGHLAHAAKVVRPGRTFMREIIRTMSTPRSGHHWVRLNTQFRADLAWWATFLTSWNGVSLFPGLPLGEAVTADASGSWGCGAFRSSRPQHWFQFEWPQHWEGVNIAVKEMVPFVIAAAMWGRTWHGQRTHFRSDNMAVVSALTRRSAKDPRLAHLLRCLFFFEAHFGFEHEASHVPGVDNGAADALSRDRLTVFFSLLPQAPRQASPPPRSLVSLLLDANLTWTSPGWSIAFQATLSEVSRQDQPAPTPVPRGDSLSSAEI